ncbi:DUF3081 family protein [Rheinheimera sp. 1928-s]|uniref:DUF3081 family protein n=1 Tax=Rheinheimera sp. 1928-s TaxID=3033803 RepID=UPI0026327F1F|nr:DUF3081 family protein [Rheinheimera sp. 1928-s]MDF3124166.1 DUF3081 family protein [Rheinheimera sp. 1928-s]
MQNLIDAKLLMKVFSKVEQQGKPVDTPFGKGFELDGMTIASGFDGYDLYFVADQVTVTLGFHQKYHIDAKDEEHIEQFIQRLKRIEAK